MIIYNANDSICSLKSTQFFSINSSIKHLTLLLTDSPTHIEKKLQLFILSVPEEIEFIII